MRVPRFPLVLILMFTVGAAGWMYAQRSNPAGTLSPEDVRGIELLVEGYTRGIDIGPEDASWVFARDAVFEYAGGTVTGEAELREFYGELRQRNTTRTIRHLLSNLVIKPSPGGATGSVYLTTIDESLTVSAVGMYEDTYVKTADGWRIGRRLYRRDLPPEVAGAQ